MHEIEALAAFEDRGPTKEGERRAAEYLEKRYRDMGLQTTVERYRVSPHYYWVYFTHTLIALLAGVVTMWTRPAWIPWTMAGVAALMALSFWGDLTTKFHIVRNVIPRYPSQNVIGYIPNEGARKHVFVSAHYDAAKVGTTVFNEELDEKVARFYKEKFDATPNVMMPMLLCMIGICVVAVVRAVWPSGAAMWAITWVIQGISSIGLIAATLGFLDIGTGHYVVGAIDNLTGIAACMSIASDVLREPLENCDLTVLSVGCEEAIMMGMVQYFKAHGRELSRDDCYFINLESVGNGTILYGVREGFVRARPYSEELVGIARSLKHDGTFPEIGTYTVRLGTDAMVPLVRGFKAISIFAMNENNFCPYYHTDRDVPENVDISVTERGRDLALAMVRSLDRR
ncbi:MAG: M28 family peptidase [Actinomycetota bacterium]